MRRTLAVSAVIAIALAATAAAQTSPRAQVVQNAPPAVAAVQIPGGSLLDGSWAVLPVTPGVLTLSPAPNGVLTGRFVSGSIDAPCTGQHHGAGFFVMCALEGTPVVFAGNAEVEEPVATQRRRRANFVGRVRLEGRSYLAQPTAQGMSVIEVDFFGEPT